MMSKGAGYFLGFIAIILFFGFMTPQEKKQKRKSKSKVETKDTMDLRVQKMVLDSLLLDMKKKDSIARKKEGWISFY